LTQTPRPLNAGTIVNLGLIATGLIAIAVIALAQLVGGDDTKAAAPLDLSVRLEPVADGFDGLVFLSGAGDGSGDRYVVEQRGCIWRIDAAGNADPEPFLDITDRLMAYHERGLLGLAFHPGFAENGRLFVTYTRAGDGAVSLSEFTVPAGPDPGAEGAWTKELPGVASTERPLLVIAQPYSQHNAGMLAFDREGMLVMSTGDGGSGNDPDRNGLYPWSLLGKLLRIDVDHGWPYTIPHDNGFAGDPAAHDEIHAIGLRNPWRFSVDRASGDIYIGDVGQSDWEEIDVLRHGSRRVSFGWSDMEGHDCFYGRPCDPNDHIPPAVTYHHVGGDTGHCAVIGGYAYRGQEGSLPDGTYLYADYCSGTIWALPSEQLSTGRAMPAVVGRLDPAFGLAQSFGEDDAGEIYLVTSGGHVLHLVAEVEGGTA
jgi:glucose/arabinose dehydrogenase